MFQGYNIRNTSLRVLVKRVFGMMSLMITFIITVMFCHFQFQTNKFYIILCNTKYYTKQSLSDYRSSLSKTTLARVRYKICYILKICQYIPFGLAALFQNFINLIEFDKFTCSSSQYLAEIEEELNGGGVISMCSCTEYQKFIILLIHEAIKTYVPLRKLKTNITYFSYEYELKNSLDVIKFLNITSHNADGSGNLLEEGIPEVIPKKRLSMLLFYWFRFGLEDIQ
ncbi:Maltase A1 [Armadillidium nasatum]|uniref:Maltase A1 n=1 Tax=Armadillidium nasatum TaxID=96803 RepID=A0A5N5T0D8_9CRUS|nr:Maltase A1 [Armadillidium nasatum]